MDDDGAGLFIGCIVLIFSVVLTGQACSEKSFQLERAVKPTTILVKKITVEGTEAEVKFYEQSGKGFVRVAVDSKLYRAIKPGSSIVGTITDNKPNESGYTLEDKDVVTVDCNALR